MLKLFKFCLSPVGKVIYNSFNNPDEWNTEDSDYTITHRKSGIILWIANGAFFFDGYNEYTGIFGYFERHIMWSKYKGLRKIRAKQQYEKIEKEIIKKMGKV